MEIHHRSTFYPLYWLPTGWESHVLVGRICMVFSNYALQPYILACLCSSSKVFFSLFRELHPTLKSKLAFILLSNQEAYLHTVPSFSFSKDFFSLSFLRMTPYCKIFLYASKSRSSLHETLFKTREATKTWQYVQITLRHTMDMLLMNRSLGPWVNLRLHPADTRQPPPPWHKRAPGSTRSCHWPPPPLRLWGRIWRWVLGMGKKKDHLRKRVRESFFFATRKKKKKNH